MSNQSHPDSRHVLLSERGDGVFVFTPCHGVRVFVPLDDAVVGATLSPLCPRDGRETLLELVADDEAESGLRPVWTRAEPEGSQ